MVGIFNDVLFVLEYLKKELVDLLFLDIYLFRLLGFDLLKIVYFCLKVIFIMVFKDYVLEVFELDVVDYLLKLFLFECFVRVILKVLYNEKN